MVDLLEMSLIAYAFYQNIYTQVLVISALIAYWFLFMDLSTAVSGLAGFTTRGTGQVL